MINRNRRAERCACGREFVRTEGRESSRKAGGFRVHDDPEAATADGLVGCMTQLKVQEKDIKGSYKITARS